MRKLTKTALAVAAIAAVSLGSYKAYRSYIVANMPEEDLLLAENVLALADMPSSKDYVHIGELLQTGLIGFETEKYRVKWTVGGSSYSVDVLAGQNGDYFKAGGVKFEFPKGEFNKTFLGKETTIIGSFAVCDFPRFGTCDRRKQYVKYNGDWGETTRDPNNRIAIPRNAL